jgi:DNA-binding NarL/FixJ family response regulator
MSLAALAPTIPTATDAPRPRLRLVTAEHEAEGTAPTRAVRVLIATGHTLVRAGYRALLESATGIEIAAEASTADQAISLAHLSEADVVLLDFALPGRDPVQAICGISDLSTANVIVLASGEDGDSALVALRAGAAGLLLMDCAPHELVAAVHAVADGEAALSPSIARRLIACFAAQPDDPQPVR